MGGNMFEKDTLHIVALNENLLDILRTGGAYYVLYTALLISKLFRREGLHGWGRGVQVHNVTLHISG
jgi:hypothetical protein